MAIQVLGVLLLALKLLAMVRAEPWTQAPLLPVLMAASQNIPGEQCRQDYSLFLNQLENFTLWAVEMFDASTKVPEGLLAGNSYHLGHFDQCMGISANLGERYIRGQYCIADIRFQSKEFKLPCSRELQPENSAWQKLQWCGDPSKVRRDTVHWALCVPASCSPEDVHTALSEALADLEPSLGVTFNVTVPPEQCSRHEERIQLGASAVTLVCLAIVISLLFITSTLFDFVCCGGNSEKTEVLPGGEAADCNKCLPVREYFLIFSARRNLPKLITLVPSQPAFDFSHALRFAFMTCIIMGHRLLLYIDQPFLNAEDYEAMFHGMGDMILANGATVVDLYFMLSGLLLGYTLLETFKKDGKVNFLLVILNFIVRIMPVYMLVVWFHTSLLSQLGSGPFWKAAVHKEEQRCIKYWWTNLIFIHNYWDPQNMCLFPSWYLATHFHMFIICLLLTMLLSYRPKLGWIMFGFAVILSVLIPFFNIWWYQLDPIIKPFPDFGPDIRNNKVFRMIYVKTHNRAAPYLVGTITGILLFKSRNSTFRLSKITSYIIFYGAWLVGIFVILSCYVFFIPDRQYNAIESGLYGSLHHISIALVASAIFFSVTFGHMNVYCKICSSPIFVTLSRLSFNAYLLHSTAQLYDQGSLRLPRYLSFYVTTWDVTGDITIAYLLALAMALMVEMPLRHLFKMLIFGRKVKKEES
ncbi:nose resistant to fluoxetine protein 6 [Anabrus simplex]|uniref:nose resistant to fluoxetine protein 6 n=1 Tax=Anabrus simplex TaxID=316456 RepID=UPI0035A2A952